MADLKLDYNEKMLILDILRKVKQSLIPDDEGKGFKEDYENWLLSITKDDKRTLDKCLRKVWEST